MRRDALKNGPGLHVFDGDTMDGSGYCGICGTDDVVPTLVQYWDPDDGWTLGVLCHYCAKLAANRGPRPDDFAYDEPRT